MSLTWGSSSPKALANAAGWLSVGVVATISALLCGTTLIEVNWQPELTIQNGRMYLKPGQWVLSDIPYM